MSFSSVDSKGLNTEWFLLRSCARILLYRSIRPPVLRRRKQKKRQRSCRNQRRAALLPAKHSSAWSDSGQEGFCAREEEQSAATFYSNVVMLAGCRCRTLSGRAGVLPYGS